MLYVTVRQQPRFKQISLDDILVGEVEILPQPGNSVLTGTVTRTLRYPSERMLEQIREPQLKAALRRFCEKHADLYAADRHSLYTSFFIPKRSGGLRKIDAPLPPLMEALRELASIFTDQFGALYHTAAFAYVKGRSTIDSAKRHQQNSSRWFLKLDFSNFFGSTTPEFLFSMLKSIFPFSEIALDLEGKILLQRALDLCFLDGGLPQGTPISPMLTNLMMIPIDHAIAGMCWRNGFVYTRYADDITISHKYDFDYNETVSAVHSILARFNAPFSINQKKTHYGSSAGRNWHLGVMLNGNNEITIGHKRKKQFKSMLCNYITDAKNGRRWAIEDVHTLQGLLSYYRMVERDAIDGIIKFYNEKFGADVEAIIRADLKNGGA